MGSSTIEPRVESRRIRVGVWANRISAVMLIGIAVFWVSSPRAASEGAFGIAADSEAAIAYAQLTAIFAFKRNEV